MDPDTNEETTETEVESVDDEGLGDLSELEGALEADKRDGDEEVEGQTEKAPAAPKEPAPGTPEARAKEREARALAAEEARERKRELAKLSEAENYIERVRAAEQRRQAELDAREAQLRSMEGEAAQMREKLLEAVRKGGLGALEALGLDLATLQAEEIERLDPVAKTSKEAQRALAELNELKAQLKAEKEEAARMREESSRQARQRQVEEQRFNEQRTLISYAAQAESVPPTVARLARSAESNPLARRTLIEAADTFAEAYYEVNGTLPVMKELVVGLDELLDFAHAPSNGMAQAAGGTRGQARTGRTMASPAMAMRDSAPRQLSDEEREQEELAELERSIKLDLSR
jgi:hypothetical protein